MKVLVRLIVLLVLCVVASCRKSEPSTPASYSIVLDTPTLTGNKVVLNWTVLGGAQVRSVQLERTSDSTFGSYYNGVVSLSSDTTSYSDTLTLSRSMYYRVRAQIYDGAQTQTISSNQQVFKRTDIDFLPFPPRSALFDKASHFIYLVGMEGQLAIYDATTRKISKTIESGALVGQCILATHNGRKELYTPRNDGWIFIYDAATLDQVDQINVGTRVAGIAYNHDKLFMSTGDYTHSLKVYDRHTKSVLMDTSGAFTDIQFRVLPGTNTELVGAYGSSTCVKLQFNAEGKLLSTTSKMVGSGYYISTNLFEILPSGDRFITGNYGAVFTTNLDYVSMLPYGSVYIKSFDFDEVNDLVYCGTSEREAHAYSLNNYLRTKRLPSKGYPIAVFYDNGTVISVSSESQSINSSTESFIEHL